MIRAALILCGVMASAGCQVTVVENLPEGATDACPAEWPGAWIALDDDGEHADAGAFVDQTCTVTLLEVRQDELQESKLKPRFAPQIVLFEYADAARAAELDADDEQPGRGWWPFAWRRSGDRMMLRPPDHRRIATLIVNGALDGETHWSSGGSSWSLLRGDAAAIREALDTPHLFESDSGMRMQRIGSKRRDLDRALERVRKRKDRE